MTMLRSIEAKRDIVVEHLHIQTGVGKNVPFADLNEATHLRHTGARSHGIPLRRWN